MHQKATFIFLLEVIAQCIGLWFFWPELGSACWAFVDNEGAKYSLRKGYTRDDDVNTILSLFAASTALTRCAPFFDRVASSAQLADSVSRGDFSMVRGLGWKHVELRLEPLWPFLRRVAGEGGFATRDHAAELLVIIEQCRLEAGLPTPPAPLGFL